MGFSSSDIHYYRLMQAWKKNENIDFNFTDCQLTSELNSENDDYINGYDPASRLFLHILRVM